MSPNITQYTPQHSGQKKSMHTFFKWLNDPLLASFYFWFPWVVFYVRKSQPCKRVCGSPPPNNSRCQLATKRTEHAHHLSTGIRWEVPFLQGLKKCKHVRVKSTCSTSGKQYKILLSQPECICSTSNWAAMVCCHSKSAFNNTNSSTSFCLRSSRCRTDLSIYFQPSRPATIWMFF